MGLPQSRQTITRYSEGEARYSMNRSGQLHVLRSRELWRILDFHSGACEVSFPVWYNVTSLMFPQFSGQEMSTEDYVLTQRHVPAERNILYICFKVVNVAVQ